MIKPRKKTRSKPKTTRKRDYKKEYREYHGKPEQIKKRDMRNKARRKMGLKVGDPREVDHKVPLSKGGSNSKRNLRIVTRRTNRKKGNKR
jgi:5-methylcytosine-specific restriction endonuclease McrA